MTHFERLTRALLSADIPPGSRILLAVSGGADSVALLRAAHSVAPAQRWDMCVGHVDHGLRGAESREDERFVHDLAMHLDLPYRAMAVPVAEHASYHHLSLEAAARELRYRALRKMLSEWEGTLLMTGHTENDQAETLLLNLLRGSGLAGLAGMRARQGPLARPFLSVDRASVLAALEEIGQVYREDSSNADTRFRRNRIRREVVPALRQVQPQVTRTLARTASLLRADGSYLDRAAEDAMSFLDMAADTATVSASIGPWLGLHPALRARTLKRMLTSFLGEPVELSAAHQERVNSAIATRTPLVGRLPHALSLDFDRSRFTFRQGPGPADDPLPASDLPVPGIRHTPAGPIAARLLTQEERERLPYLLAVTGPLHTLLDAGAGVRDLTVGPRRPGDRMRPAGGSGSRKVQDILVDAHTDRAIRDRIPVIRSAAGIVWIAGIAASETALATVSSDEVLHLSWSPSPAVLSATIQGLFAG